MKGQSLIELVIVVAVIVMVVGGLVFTTISSLRNASLAKNQAQATKLAQEGLEKARVGRDRNQAINALNSNVDSWNGVTDGSKAVWNYQINGNCGNSTPPPPTPPTYCYFNVSNVGALTYFATSSIVPPGAEQIPPAPATPLFYRMIILSDDSTTYNQQKTVTSIVKWTDFAGEHTSKLTTILRKL